MKGGNEVRDEGGGGGGEERETEGKQLIESVCVSSLFQRQRDKGKRQQNSDHEHLECHHAVVSPGVGSV